MVKQVAKEYPMSEMGRSLGGLNKIFFLERVYSFKHPLSGEVFIPSIPLLAKFFIPTGPSSAFFIPLLQHSHTLVYKHVSSAGGSKPILPAAHEYSFLNIAQMPL